MLVFKNLFLLIFLISLCLLFYRFHFDLTVANQKSATLSMEAFYQNLAKGCFVPRWADEFNDGYGSPILILVPPLRNYLGSFIHWLGKLPFQSISRILFLNLNLFIFPLCLWLFYKLRKDKSYWLFLMTAFLLASLILNNEPSVYFYLGLPLFSFSLYLITQTKKTLKIFLIYLSLFITTFSLTAFYWLPAIVEAKEIEAFLTNINQRKITNPSPKTLKALTETEKVELIYQHRPPFLWYGYELNLPANAHLQFHTFNYPGWQIFFDSLATTIEKPDIENQGLITFISPPTPGYHFLEIVFEKTKDRMMADNISYSTLAFLISLGGYVYFKKRS